MGRKFKNTTPFLERLSFHAREGITLCNWSPVSQMGVFTSKRLEDQNCCAVASLVVRTDVERLKNCILGCTVAAMG